MTYGTYYCVNIVTDKANWANGVLLRAISMPGEDERIASGPGLLAKRFGLTKDNDNSPVSVENGLWLAESSLKINMKKIVKTKRIGISKAKDLEWRWYMQNSRSVSKRAKGDYMPSRSSAWQPTMIETK